MTAIKKGVKTTFITRTRAFKKLTKWAFAVCDKDGKGELSKAELYAGILLVHLNLAKYAGAAACYPPTRKVIDELFEASDDDQSGFIDEAEFEQILIICCAQISSRLFIYFLILILLVPYVSEAVITALLHTDDWFQLKLAEKADSFRWMEHILTFGEIAQKLVSTILFFLVVPIFFNWIDRSSRLAAEMYETDREDSHKEN